MLGVQNQTLEEHGSVSEAVVEEMSSGALNLSGADIAVAVSGVAGPDGGSDEKPVGTVWFAWAVRDSGKVRTDTSFQKFDGGRELIRELTVVYALQGVMDRL
jgi:nicotinamide-nucleotide amidase